MTVVPFPSERSEARLGRYRLIAVLGEGGMGTIHLGVAGGFGGFRKLFVVKELKAELTHNDEFLRLFMREARLAARLSHPNVVHTMEADQDRGRYFLAMEFLDGQPLSEILRRAQKPPAVSLPLRLSVVCQALAGLHYAHELRDYDGRALEVVHRDVSPTNIFVTYDGQVKVLDFGIARAGDAEGTQPRMFKGKIGYASPEQLRMRPGDRRIDVFAAGVVLWEAIALRHLVRGKPSPQVFEARLTGTEPRIAQIVPEIDPALAQICDRAMAVDMEERYPSAEALRQDLADYLAERKLTCDAASIAQVLRSKFADERSAIHRVIEDQLRQEEDVTHSFITTRDPLLFSAPTRSFAPGADTPGESDESEAPFAAKRRPGMKRWLAGACALAAAAALVRFQRTEEDASARRARPPESTGATPAAPAASAAPATTPIQRSAEVAREETEQVVSTEAPRRSMPAVRSAVGATPRGPLLAPQRAHALQPLVRDASAESANHAQPVRPALSQPATDPLDVDLRRVAPSTRRQLDVENPFR
jgi:serine/threonine-protein kinase